MLIARLALQRYLRMLPSVWWFVLGITSASCTGSPDGAGPHTDGPLRPRIVYPAAGDTLAPGPTTLVFGSVGSGRASLVINGDRVRVHPNGSFFARLRVPQPRDPVFRLVAAVGKDTVKIAHRLWLGDRASSMSRGVDRDGLGYIRTVIARSGDSIPVELRTPTDTHAWVEAQSKRWPLAHSAEHPHLRRAWVPAKLMFAGATMVVNRQSDTTRFPLPRPMRMGEEVYTTVVKGNSAGAYAGLALGSDRLGGPPAVFIPTGLPGVVTGRIGGSTRVRVRGGTEWWLDSASAPVRAQRAQVRSPEAMHAPSPTVAVTPGWTEVAIALPEPVPFTVVEGRHRLVVVLYGTSTTAAQPGPLPRGSHVRRVLVGQSAPSEVRITAELGRPAHGYTVQWVNRRMVVRIRRPPAVDPSSPLRGLLIAIDAGHPPGGTVGPTGLKESEVTLDVAQRAATLLRARGARVLMTRSDGRAVPLAERAEATIAADADALVSIHADARLGPGDPYRDNGSRAYYLGMRAAPLADEVQRSIARRLQVPAKGATRRDLALTRPTWMPAVLCEGTMLVIPEEEAKLRTPEYRQSYALGIVDGLEAYFRSVGFPRP